MIGIVVLFQKGHPRNLVVPPLVSQRLRLPLDKLLPVPEEVDGCDVRDGYAIYLT